MTDPQRGYSAMTDGGDAGVEAVARWLCAGSEYHEGNWRLYLVKARAVIAVYLAAVAA